MGKKGKKYENEEIVDCKACNGVISLGFYMGRGDIVCCEECDAEYLINSRKPLQLELLNEDDDDDVFDTISDYDDDDVDEDGDEDYNVSDYDYDDDDDYNDGRYD